MSDHERLQPGSVDSTAVAGEVVDSAFQIEVNVGSGRKPCDLEWRDAAGIWHPAGAVRIDAPEVHFTAHERDA